MKILEKYWKPRIERVQYARLLVDGEYRRTIRVVLVMDQLSTCLPASLDEAFGPPQANGSPHGWIPAMFQVRQLVENGADQTPQVVTPMPFVPHGEALATQSSFWTDERIECRRGVDRQFITEDVRFKPKRLQPLISI